MRGRIADGREEDKGLLPWEPEMSSDVVHAAGTAEDRATRPPAVGPAPGIAEGEKGGIDGLRTDGSDPLAVVLDRVSAVKKYPPLARLRGITGTAWVSFRVGDGGTPERIEIASRPAPLFSTERQCDLSRRPRLSVGPAAFRVGLRFELSE